MDCVLTLTSLQAICSRFVGFMKAVEAIVAAFAPKRIQEEDGHHHLSRCSMRSPHEIVSFAFLTFGRHGSSVRHGIPLL
jgi:hypothetical protein